MASQSAGDDGIIKKRKGKMPAPYVNVTPMIDVLLVLLIIFMIIAPAKPHKFETKIPSKPQEEEKNAIQPPSDLLMVEVKNNGTGLDQAVELNSKPMQLTELSTTLKDVLESRPNKTVFIKAPKDKPYGDIVSVIDAVKGAGATTI